MSLPRSRVVAYALLASLTFAHIPAFAQSDEDRAAARQLAKDGEKAINEKRWADAIDMFTRAESLVHSPIHLLFLARASANAGKLVKARENYLKITKETIAPDKAKVLHDAKASAEKELAALETRIPQLKVVVEGGEGKDPVVTMDGAPLPAALVGVFRPTDPGAHKLLVKAGSLTAEQSVELKEGASETITLTLKGEAGTKTDPKEGPKTDPKEGPKTDGDPKPPVDTPPPSDGGTNGLRIGSFVAIGVGVVGLGVGTVFLLKSNSKKKEADDLCCAAANKPKVEALDADAKSAKSLSTVSFIVGGVALAAGVTMFFLSSGSDKKAATGPWVRPYAGIGTVGLTGAF